MGMRTWGSLSPCFEQDPAPGWLFGIKRNPPGICSVGCAAGERESWDGSRPGQEGAVGTCSPPGLRNSGGPPHCLERFGPQTDLGSMVLEMGAGLGRDNPLNPSSVQLPRRFGVLQGKLRHRQQHGQSLPCGGGGSEGASSSSSPSPRKSEKGKNSFALIFTKLLIGLR